MIPSKPTKKWTTGARPDRPVPMRFRTGAFVRSEKEHPQTLKALLRAHGFKATPARLAILGLLSEEKMPLPAPLVCRKLAKKHGIATAYRALEGMAKAGLVAKVDLSHDHAHYELATGRIHHHHAVCTSCGDIEDVTDCDALKLNHKVQNHLKKFSRLHSHSLEFFGLCRKCAQN